jgi:excisionase family DNA binding protein
MSDPKLLTIGATARLLSCSTRHVHELIRRGDLEAIGHRRGRRVITASVDAYIERERLGYARKAA